LSGGKKNKIKQNKIEQGSYMQANNRDETRRLTNKAVTLRASCTNRVDMGQQTACKVMSPQLSSAQLSSAQLGQALLGQRPVMRYKSNTRSRAKAMPALLQRRKKNKGSRKKKKKRKQGSFADWSSKRTLRDVDGWTLLNRGAGGSGSCRTPTAE
jgi:hypothetical protein